MTDTIKPNYDLVIGILACDTDQVYCDRIQNIKNTWYSTAKHFSNVKVLFFLGEEIGMEGDDLIHLPGVKNGHSCLSYKFWNGFNYMYNNFKAKYVAMVDSDVYLNIPKLLKFLNGFDTNKKLYIGGHGDIRKIHGEDVYFYSGGPGCIITTTLLEYLYKKHTNNVDKFMEKWRDICTHETEHLSDCSDVAIAYLIHMYNKYSDNESDKIEILRHDQHFFHCNILRYSGCPNCSQGTIENFISNHCMDHHNFEYLYNVLNYNNHFV